MNKTIIGRQKEIETLQEALTSGQYSLGLIDNSLTMDALFEIV